MNYTARDHAFIYGVLAQELLAGERGRFETVH